MKKEAIERSYARVRPLGGRVFEREQTIFSERPAVLSWGCDSFDRIAVLNTDGRADQSELRNWQVVDSLLLSETDLKELYVHQGAPPRDACKRFGRRRW